MDIFGGTTFLEAPALECNFIEIFLQAPALECIFGGAWSSDIFGGTSSTLYRLFPKYTVNGVKCSLCIVPSPLPPESFARLQIIQRWQIGEY